MVHWVEVLIKKDSCLHRLTQFIIGKLFKMGELDCSEAIVNEWIAVPAHNKPHGNVCLARGIGDSQHILAAQLLNAQIELISSPPVTIPVVFWEKVPLSNGHNGSPALLGWVYKYLSETLSTGTSCFGIDHSVV